MGSAVETRRSRWMCFLLLSFFATRLPAEETPGALPVFRSIEITPAQIDLRSKRAESQIVVTGIGEDGRRFDVSRDVRLQSRDEKIARLDGSRVSAVADGETVVTARIGDHSASAKVAVSKTGEPDRVRLRTEILPLITRLGCNAGSCHGSPQGKGGFSLSLQAYDLDADEQVLTHGSRGRRTTPIAPDESLLLKKPLLRVPHVGGKKLRQHDFAYELLRQWIAEGARPDRADEPKCTSINVFPAVTTALRLPRAAQQLRIEARFDDGSIRDVTRLTTYTSSNSDLLTCDSSGLITGRKRGVGAVTVRYLSHVQSVDVTIIENVNDFRWESSPATGKIDQLVNARLRELQFVPAAVCDDATFLRRVTLDLTGLLPTASQVREFLADAATEKRAKLIDRLLATDEFARFWALKTADLMRVTPATLKEGRAELFATWLRESWRSNQPFDAFAREILTASGDTLAVGPANYFYGMPKSEDLAETTAELFMGSRINCAKCHNHPFENWTQNDYYRIAAVFAQMKNEKGTIGLNPKGEMKHPTSGAVMLPWGSDAPKSDDPAASDRRKVFVDWLTSADNPFFARVEVNRLWANLFGRGIVHPVDDFRSSNPPVNRELLDGLAEEFVHSGFDRRHIIRLICNSQAYQRSSQVSDLNAADLTLFSHHIPRRLTAEQLQDAIGYASRTLQPTTAVPGELEKGRPQLEALLAELPKQQPEWEATLQKQLEAHPCWQEAWWYVGAFPLKKFDEAVAAVFPPESEPDFTFSKTYENGKLSWKRHPEWKDGETHLTLDGRAGPHYLARKIHTAQGGKALLQFGGNGSLKVWLNDVVVMDQPVNRALKPGDAPIEVDLKPGENRLLLKIANGGGFFGFYFNLATFDGKPPEAFELPLETAELLSIPSGQRTEEQRRDLARLHQEAIPEIVSLKDRVARMTEWLDYQTQRATPTQSDFLRAFGQPKREGACTCERMSAPAIDQALQTLNGDVMRKAVMDGAKAYAGLSNTDELLDELYLSAFARPPSEKERAVATGYLGQKSDRQAAVEDLLWAVMNTREFQFQH